MQHHRIPRRKIKQIINDLDLSENPSNTYKGEGLYEGLQAPQ